MPKEELAGAAARGVGVAIETKGTGAVGMFANRGLQAKGGRPSQNGAHVLAGNFAVIEIAIAAKHGNTVNQRVGNTAHRALEPACGFLQRVPALGTAVRNPVLSGGPVITVADAHPSLPRRVEPAAAHATLPDAF